MWKWVVKLVLLFALSPALAEKPVVIPTPDFSKTPQTVEELREIETRVRNVIEDCRATTVNVQLSAGSGSGVIVSEDGFVLTAAHVASSPGRDVRIALTDGRTVDGKTLGRNVGMDSALIKITSPGPFPFRKLGSSNNLRAGQWVFGLGHPLGLQKDRPPVLRIGRILPRFDRFIRTDCTLIAGDSGGPLFDLEGHVVGIHSRIGSSTEFNMHVPIDTFVKTWESLENSESVGEAPRPIIGVEGRDEGRGFRVTSVVEDGPAEIAGIQVDDLIVAVNASPVRARQDLLEILGEQSAGDEVKIDIRRNRQRMTVTAVLEMPAR